MANSPKYAANSNGDLAKAPRQEKGYHESSFVVKKTQQAKETLQKFPVPEKYAK